MKYYVNRNAKRSGQGTKDYPFKSIQEAANLAKPGDDILVYPGIYRENVNPINGGRPKRGSPTPLLRKEGRLSQGQNPLKLGSSMMVMCG